MTTTEHSGQRSGGGLRQNPATGQWEEVGLSVAFGHLYISHLAPNDGITLGVTESIALSSIATITDDELDDGFRQLSVSLAGVSAPILLRVRPELADALRDGRSNPETTLDLGPITTTTPPPAPDPIAGRAQPASSGWPSAAGIPPASPTAHPAGPPGYPPQFRAPQPGPIARASNPSYPSLGTTPGAVCTICNQQFTDIGSLSQHHHAMHSGSANPASSPPPRSGTLLTWMIVAVVVALVALVLVVANSNGRSDDSPTVQNEPTPDSSSSSRSAADDLSPPALDEQDVLDFVWEELSYSDRQDICDTVAEYGVDLGAAAIASASDGAVSVSSARTFLNRKC